MTRTPRSGPVTNAPGAVAAAVAVALLCGACGGPELLDPTEPPLAEQRERLVAQMESGLRAVAEQLGASDALGVQVQTVCTAGEDNWKHTDVYRSRCEVHVTAGYPLGTALDQAVGDLEQLLALEERLADAGWTVAEWSLDAPGITVDAEHLRQHGEWVDDVTGVRSYSQQGDGASLSVGFRSAAEPVDPAMGAYAGYYQHVEGSAWQDAWADRRHGHPALVVGYGRAVLAEQPR